MEAVRAAYTDSTLDACASIDTEWEGANLLWSAQVFRLENPGTDQFLCLQRLTGDTNTVQKELAIVLVMLPCSVNNFCFVHI